jgi:hypothetical protein
MFATKGTGKAMKDPIEHTIHEVLAAHDVQLEILRRLIAELREIVDPAADAYWHPSRRREDTR